MALALPNLDDRRWSDLVEEARALIPFYAPGWTDHNVHDPGVTLIELLAWIAEMDIYRVNTIPERRRRKFLSLLGEAQRPPQGARTVVAFTARDPRVNVVELPKGSEVQGTSEVGAELTFQLLHSVSVAPGGVTSVLVEKDGRWEDVAPTLKAGRDTVLLWGTEPQIGATILIGLAHPLPKDKYVSLYFVLEPPPTGDTASGERPRRLRGEHHSVRLGWEYLDEDNGWTALDSRAAGDRTRAFTQSGRVILGVDGDMDKAAIVHGGKELHWLRCRYVHGAYDAAPRVRRVVLNGVEARQASATMVPLEAPLDASALSTPSRQFTLPPLVEGNRVHVEIKEPDDLGNLQTRIWRQRPDFLDSGKRDPHYTVDAHLAQITFGDGERGRAFPSGCGGKAKYLTTRGSEGNASALQSKPRGMNEPFAFAFPIESSGGASGETLDEAQARVIRSFDNPRRAVSLADYERQAITTPGTSIARAAAVANFYPGLPCITAPGVVTVAIVPYLPADRPTPSAGLLTTVRRRLCVRRLLGTRVEVVAPAYVELAVRARVRALAGVDLAALREAAAAELNRFLHPLTGGHYGTGWPFGRDVYRSEVMQVLDQTRGVDHVVSLEFVDAGGRTSCGNLCVPRLALIAAGRHEIEAISQDAQ
jgi:predicted phage baseplate assembly protein